MRAHRRRGIKGVLTVRRIAIVLLAATCLLTSAAPASAGRGALKQEVRHLRTENACLKSRLGWEAGRSSAYRRAWFDAAGGISDYLVRDEPVDVLSSALIDASENLNASLRRIGKAPTC